MRPLPLKELLASQLTPDELAVLITSYDIVGSIAILDIPLVLTPKEHIIAQAVLDSHKNVYTVLKKSEQHDGEFRTQKLMHLLGERTKETRVKESGCTFLVDVEQVYYSVRLSTERLRIATCITPGENVLVMFSGAAPYVVIIAKKSVAGHIVGVEKNPAGHRYGLENLRLNKITSAELHNADCADVSFLNQHFDRIVMPAPANAMEFIGAALAVAKHTVRLHVYCFGQEHEIPLLTHQIEDACAAHGYGATQFSAVKTGQPAPYTFRYCIDCVVQKRK